MKKYVRLITFLCTLTALWSCEKSIVDEESEQQLEATSRLNILTRAPGDESVISYPVTVYIMDATGTCIKQLTLNDGDEQLEAMLPAGEYQVYAIAGARTDSYTLPSATDATATSEIVLKDGATEGDLMTASNSIKIGQEETNTLTLALTRKVMQLQRVEISNVPTDVTAVSVAIYPISKGLLLNGNYTTTTVEQTVNLERLSNGTTWCSTNSRYMMPAVGGATVKVTLTDDNGRTSYTYTCPQALEANHHVNITGQYIGTQGIRMEGTISGAVWGEDVTVNFTFGENGTTEEPQQPQNPEEGVEEGTAPTANTKYNDDCFVLSVKDDETGNYAIATLIHKKAVEIKGSEMSDENELKAAIEAALATYNTVELSGWRLPTQSDMDGFASGLFYSLFETWDGASGGNSDLYYYQDGDNIKTFTTSYFDRPYTAGQYLRPVTTLKFRK